MTAKPFTKPPMPNAEQSLNDWIAHLFASNARVQMRLRGNVLHVLTETPHRLHQSGAVTRLVDALMHHPAGTDVITTVYPQAYQLYIYSRRRGHSQPDWTAPIYLNRLEHHQVQLQQQAGASLKIADAVQHDGAAPNGVPSGVNDPLPDDSTTAIVLSHLSLAKQGDADAIAWYLSEVLSSLDVGVWVSVRAASRPVPGHPDATTDTEAHAEESASDRQRLWVWCEAAYSPDPLLIAEPVTERLRQLELSQFKDAAIVIQVHGEDTPDWSLRVDLTPADEMLREWARWGDEGAIARLLDAALREQAAAVTMERKDESLHCIMRSRLTAEPPAIPDEAAVMAAIAPLLEELAPQGVHRLMVYGQAPDADTPDWVRCLNLPALEHPDLAIAPTELAKQGNLAALAYLLTRLLNPDLEAQLATGGIRIQALQRDQLLHIMADAPICPTRRQVVPQILDFLEVVNLSDIKGLRLYGRRAGQQRPAWSFGKDLEARPAIVPKAESMFAVSDQYVGDLLSPSEGDESNAEAESRAIARAFQTAWQQGRDQVRQFLYDTQLVVPQQELTRTPTPLTAEDSQDAVKIGLVWATVGILLALQVDWVFGQLVKPGPVADNRNAASAAETSESVVNTAANDALTDDAWERQDWLAEQQLPALPGPDADESTAATDSVFNDEQLVASPDRSLAPTTDLLSHSPYPSFRSQQMDEKLALYHQLLAESGPPDVLVIGSSRALRGVDPAALQRELAALGQGELSVFNFGVNGSTAQVVDLTIRRVLKPDQLPRIIIWADGARAFNSGRTDITFNAIEASDGYRELGRRNPEVVTANADDPDAVVNVTDDEPQAIGEALRGSYQALDQTLSDQLGERSAIYPDRDELKAFVRDRLLTPLTASISSSPDAASSPNTSDLAIPEGSQIDFDGFLALDVRFNPATYFQLYARVAGAYDSDYEDFALEGKQTAAFEQLLDYTQQRNIPVIFVNTPLTDEYLDGYRSDAEEDFQRLMLRYSATEEDFIFRDLGQVWTNRYDYFSDPSHLNRYGAYQVSLRLAQDPMIPWPRARDLSAANPDRLSP
ncbi:TonB-dependent receptor [Leptolyngbya iicbica]|uniref:TonB-dependent receptor n=2 Tax=Cyanophyceae TaxID=3028117 RepID=A0A4Q7EFZ9_9CYAN|nr:TonB-dependent receptor [Leptolyngbya sp. LK]RZM82764.1 TonB-dependent receptor [Leptolyngbya sp. LK]